MKKTNKILQLMEHSSTCQFNFHHIKSTQLLSLVDPSRCYWPREIFQLLLPPSAVSLKMLKNVAQHNEINFTNAISSLSLLLTQIVIFRLAEFNLKEWRKLFVIYEHGRWKIFLIYVEMKNKQKIKLKVFFISCWWKFEIFVW